MGARANGRRVKGAGTWGLLTEWVGRSVGWVTERLGKSQISTFPTVLQKRPQCDKKNHPEAPRSSTSTGGFMYHSGVSTRFVLPSAELLHTHHTFYFHTKRETAGLSLCPQDAVRLKELAFLQPRKNSRCLPACWGDPGTRKPTYNRNQRVG